MNFQSLVDFNYWTLIAQICNLFIQMYLFKRFLFKPVKKIFEKRQQEVNGIYEEAAAAKADADAAKAQYESHLEQARQEAEAITARAEESARERSEAILKDAKAESAALRERASRDIALERRKAMNEAKDEISSLAVDIASKVARKEIGEKEQEALVEQFIEELGKEK